MGTKAMRTGRLTLAVTRSPFSRFASQQRTNCATESLEDELYGRAKAIEKDRGDAIELISNRRMESYAQRAY